MSFKACGVFESRPDHRAEMVWEGGAQSIYVLNFSAKDAVDRRVQVWDGTNQREHVLLAQSFHEYKDFNGKITLKSDNDANAVWVVF